MATRPTRVRPAAMTAPFVTLLVSLSVLFVPPLRADPVATGAEGQRSARIVVEKSRHEMTLFRDGEAPRTYPVSLGRGGMEPKQKEGDRRTPEGLYTIIAHNPNSRYYRSLRISYPSARDIEMARSRGFAPGGDIMIHGLPQGLGWLGPWQHLIDWTAGCIAVTNAEIDDLWRLVPDGTPIEIRP